MANAFGLPEDAVAQVRDRDRLCVYCHTIMRPYGSDGPRTSWATIEHLNHLPPWDDPTTIAICCVSCNSSRSDRTHERWFTTDYCRVRGIDASTLAKPFQDYLTEVG